MYREVSISKLDIIIQVNIPQWGGNVYAPIKAHQNHLKEFPIYTCTVQQCAKNTAVLVWGQEESDHENHHYRKYSWFDGKKPIKANGQFYIF